MTTATFWRRTGAVTLAVAIVSIVSLALFIGKGASAQNSSTCTDSDNTLDYYGMGPEQVSEMNDSSKYIRGSIISVVSDGIQHNVDVCETSNKVREHYCDRGEYLAYIILDCPNGCKDGACVKESAEEPTAECTDSDSGSDYFTKGTVKTSASPLMNYTDICGPGSSEIPAGHELIEWNCDENGGVINEYYNCPNGCKGGACVSEEELARIEKQKQIKEMLKGISGMSGLIRGLNVMEKAFQQVAKDGVATPAELAQTMARVKEIRPEIVKFQNKKAENITDEAAEMLADNLNELCEIGLTLTEWGEQLPQFLQISARMKQSTKDLKRAKSDVKLAVKAAARSKYGLSDKVEELNGAIEALKTTLDDAVEIISLDEKGEKINEFYDQFQDIYDAIGVINALQNVGQARTQWNKRVIENTRIINQLKRAKFDVAELAVMNDEVRAKLDELKTALAKKPLDRDEVKGLFEDLRVFQSEFIDLADQLRGVKSALPKVQAAKIDTAQFKNFGAFSQFCGVPQTNDNGEEVLE